MRLFVLLVLWTWSLVNGKCLGRGTLGARHSDHGRQRYYTLYSPTSDADAAVLVAHQLGGRFEGPIGELTTYYEMSVPEPPSTCLSIREEDEVVAQFHRLKTLSLSRRDDKMLALQSIETLTAQVARRRLFKRGAIPRQIDTLVVIENSTAEQAANAGNTSELETLQAELGIHDPGFSQQWHLWNQEQYGNDANVTGVWRQGITGKNVVVAILDDGLDMESKDLKDNFFKEGSWDFNDNTKLPKPRLPDDNHGTRCAGEIAASRNDACGVGMAYDAKVAGIRILSADLTEEDEARALNYKYQENHIYSCSWGPADLGEVAEGPKGIVLDAFRNGVEKGRSGLGTVFVFASGNGGANDDNCNFDGYTNSIYTITVGAVDRMDNFPYYAERCSAQLVVTYSSGSGSYIYTTDVGKQTCADHHGGTSAAAPLAAGVFALVLSVRPDLTWRDMQRLCVETGVPFSLQDSDWTPLPSGRLFSHKFGYGKLDAYAIVERAKAFQHVGPQTHLVAWTAPVPVAIPDLTGDGDRTKALQSVIPVTKKMVQEAGLGRLEHVTATVYIEHGRRGDLEILLESPHGVTSQLGTPRRSDWSTEGLKDWTFMSVKHWDEDPVGNWTLWVIDERNPQETGQFTNWTLALWGEQADREPVQLARPPSIGSGVPHTIVPQNAPPTISESSPSKSATMLPPWEPDSADKARGTEKGTQIPMVAAGKLPDKDTAIDRRVFLYTLGTLFLIAAMAGGVYAIYQRMTEARSVKDTTAYTRAPQTDNGAYEFEELEPSNPTDADEGMSGACAEPDPAGIENSEMSTDRPAKVRVGSHGKK